MNDISLVIILLTLGGLLPLAGLFRLALKARKNLKESNLKSVEERLAEGSSSGFYDIDLLADPAKSIARSPILEWEKIRWDILLVGSGIASATAGSIWSIFL